MVRSGSIDINFAEMRQSCRVGCDLPVEVRPHGLKSTKIYAQACDLSDTGMGLRSEIEIPQGILLEAQFVLPDQSSTTTVLCKIIHSKTAVREKWMYRAGVRFLKISEAERKLIRQYVFRMEVKQRLVLKAIESPH